MLRKILSKNLILRRKAGDSLTKEKKTRILFPSSIFYNRLHFFRHRFHLFKAVYFIRMAATSSCFDSFVLRLFGGTFSIFNTPCFGFSIVILRVFFIVNLYAFLFFSLPYLALWLKVIKYVNSNSNCTITFTFGLIHFRNVWIPLSPHTMR